MRQTGLTNLQRVGLALCLPILATGCEDMFNLPPQNEPPQNVTLLATPTGGTAPLDVDFAGAAIDPDGTIATYRLDFGDGSPMVADPNTSHTYSTIGTFTAMLFASDDEGAVGTASIVISTAACNDDGACDAGEDCATCPTDCGVCGTCGDGVCDPTEDCNSCSADCPQCISFAGDVVPLFTECLGCHLSGNSFALTATAADYVAASSRIDLGDPQSSRLLECPTGICSIPTGTHFQIWDRTVPADEVKYNLILQWIQEGAPDN